MTSFHSYVIVNPKSANGETGRRWSEIRAALSGVLSRWDQAFTAAPKEATQLARRAVAQGYEMIVSVGGDGTNNEVVNGLLDEQGGVVRPGVVFACVRRGTGGDFARHLGLSSTLPAAVAHLAGRRTTPLDLGWIEAAANGSGGVRRAFVNIASFGLSGVVDDRVNRATKALGGRASFLIGLAKGLIAFRPQDLRVEIDGDVLHQGPVVTGACANGQYFGGGMHFAPTANASDGAFDVVVQTRAGPREIAKIRDVYRGRILEWPTVLHRRGREVRAAAVVAGREPVLLDVDGEQVGQLPATFRMLPAAVRLKR